MSEQILLLGAILTDTALLFLFAGILVDRWGHPGLSLVTFYFCLNGFRSWLLRVAFEVMAQLTQAVAQDYPG